MNNASLLRKLRSALSSIADPVRAAGQRAYMKSEMPYHGIATAPLNAVTRELFSPLIFASEDEWRDAVLFLWRKAQFREERYAAIHLSGIKAAARWQTMRSLPMYEEMIVTGAWWDYVDAIAAHRLGTILRNERRPMRKMMLAWSRDDDMWKRRSSIICQLTFKKETDLELLYACIEPSLASREFFLRKAIGWALRQYAWTDPDEIVRYVTANAEQLSPLSKREALKNVGRSDEKC